MLRFDPTLMARKGDRIVGQLIANEQAVMAARDRKYRVETDTLDKRLAEMLPERWRRRRH